MNNIIIPYLFYKIKRISKNKRTNFLYGGNVETKFY